MEEKEMTKQEAIDTLKLYSNNRFGIVSEPFWKALNIALEALKAQNSDEPDWENEAPEWANYYHKDSSDHCWWYECEPKKTITYAPTIGRIKLAKAAHPFAAAKSPIEKLFKRPDK